jgi:hypothetical protein
MLWTLSLRLLRMQHKQMAMYADAELDREMPIAARQMGDLESTPLESCSAIYLLTLDCDTARVSWAQQDILVRHITYIVCQC